jgi:cytochrome c biogenesis protein CcmG/thiol:disulfide interchange protein DsbE
MRKKDKQLIIIISIIFLVIISLAITSQILTQSSIDFELPVIDKNGLQQRTVKLSDYKGHVILLEFAVEWCPHCANMVPVLKQIYDEFSKKGVVLITVMINYNTNLEKTIEFLKKHDPPWLHLFDVNLKVTNKYNIQATPTFVIIDKSFKIVEKFSGEYTYIQLKNKLERYL